MDQQDYAAKLQAVLDSADIPVNATELIGALYGAFVIVPRELFLALDPPDAHEDAYDDLLFPDHLIDIAVTFK